MARRSPRGGARAGSPGQSYPNRTDLPGKVLPITTAPSAGYGQAVASARSQAAVPMGVPRPAGPAPSAPSGVTPGGLPSIFAKTARPDEPVTAGAASGPGPGPSILGQANEMARADRDALAPYLPPLIFHSRRATPSFTSWLRTLRSGV